MSLERGAQSSCLVPPALCGREVVRKKIGIDNDRCYLAEGTSRFGDIFSHHKPAPNFSKRRQRRGKSNALNCKGNASLRPPPTLVVKRDQKRVGFVGVTFGSFWKRA